MISIQENKVHINESPKYKILHNQYKPVLKTIVNFTRFYSIISIILNFTY